MNPSTKGWINKFGSIITESGLLYRDFEAMYSGMRQLGFTYGFCVAHPDAFKLTQGYSHDEIAKINLLTCLYHVYKFNTANKDFYQFAQHLLQFYKTLEVSDLSLWDKLLTNKDDASILERLLNDRVQIDDNLLTRNFNKTLTNSLLFVDVLTYKMHFESTIDSKQYASRLEYVIMNIIYDVLYAIKQDETGDKQRIKQFKESLSFIDSNATRFDRSYILSLEKEFDGFEKQYFLDIASLAVWKALYTDDTEYNFIKGICDSMNFPESKSRESLDRVTLFFNTYKDSQLLLKHTGLLSNFYENSSQLVTKLIKRNSKRLVKELHQSKGLLKLLGKSTTEDLTKEEQEKMQGQLLDLLKTIPSLAIFMLPGGAILLPIFAKLIPNLLRSAFDVNRIEKKK